MQTVILKSNSKSELKLLTDFAKKIGIQVKYLSESEMEDLGMLNASKRAAQKNMLIQMTLSRKFGHDCKN